MRSIRWPLAYVLRTTGNNTPCRVAATLDRGIWGFPIYFKFFTSDEIHVKSVKVIRQDTSVPLEGHTVSNARHVWPGICLSAVDLLLSLIVIITMLLWS